MDVSGVPRRSPAQLARPRLLAALGAADDAQLVVVHAGSGFGKSSLLASWAHLRDPAEPLVWVTASATLARPAEFWETLAERLGALPGSRPGMDPLDLDRDVGPGFVAEVERVLGAVEGGLSLIVDEFEWLAGGQIERDLIRLLTRVPRLRLLVGTRAVSLVSDATTAARVDTVLIGTDDLRFVASEVAELALQLGLELPPREVRALWRAADGWPLGVRVLLEQRRRQRRPAREYRGFGDEPGDDRLVIDRLLRDVVSDLAGFDALMVTSVVSEFSPSQARAFGVEVDRGELLDALVERGLGSWSEEGGSRHFRLHPLVLRMLRDELGRRPRLERKAYARLGRWHAAGGRWLPAFAAAVRAEDWQSARRWLRKAGEFLDIIERGGLDLAAVPPQSYERDPVLRFVVAQADATCGLWAKATAGYEAVIQASDALLATDRRAPVAERGWWALAKAWSLRHLGRWPEVLPAFEAVERILDQAAVPPDEELCQVRSLCRNAWASALINLDEPDDVPRLLRPQCGPDRSTAPRLRLLHAASLQALAAARSGRLTDAAALAGQVRSMPGAAQFVGTVYANPLQLAELAVAVETQAVTEAEESLQSLACQWPTIERWPLLLEYRVRLQWYCGDAAAALRTLRAGRKDKADVWPIPPPFADSLTGLEATLLLALGEATRAARLLGRDRSRPRPRLALPVAQLLFQQGRYQEVAVAVPTLLRDDRLAEDVRVSLLLLGAAARSRSGAPEPALLDRAVRTARRIGARAAFGVIPADDLAGFIREVPELADFAAIPARFPPPSDQAHLTPRERTVLSALASLSGVQQIAATLQVSPNTVKSQLRAIYRKLGVSSREEAITRGLRDGLL
ncbi:MAG: LuxR C-terminal-related transcriptional regulator [Propionicimonas sp.]|uniref:LuxR C-terminal-related transcriptional regulator n=1 Tax=Propionicimonas sp. TaxID=1955623 RepID=UPI002B218DC5|nr:LuxR C-terminal-related transcriptional regulator [Propionicimonas sp.]MEA4944967.1 LuxR C-terminal-related transcriptional regulator [Propionicimonas sp.]